MRAIDGEKVNEFIQGLKQIRIDEMDTHTTPHEQSWIEGSRHSLMEIEGHIKSGRFDVKDGGESCNCRIELSKRMKNYHIIGCPEIKKEPQ